MIPVLRSAAIRSSRTAAMTSRRSFSSECAPAQRIKCVFEEYRQQHYSRETPNRFRKEILSAAEGVSPAAKTGEIEVDCLNKILVNIGRPEEKLSEDELKTILADIGQQEDKRSIPVSKMLDLM